jgi:hypothetical protein
LKYIESRIEEFVVGGNVKDNWLQKIKELKEDYKKIVL